MSLTLLSAAGLVAGLNGMLKHSDANDFNSEASKILNNAYSNYYKSLEALEKDKDDLNHAFDALGRKKVSVWGNELVKFLQIFLRYKNVKFSKDIQIEDKHLLDSVNTTLLCDMKNSALVANKVSKKELGIVDVSVYVGIAAYGTCMLSAATGISSIVAFANESKFVNFLGGSASLGSLGVMNVCNIVLGPILAITGEIENAKAKENLAEAKMVAAKTAASIEKIHCMQTGLHNAISMANLSNSFLSETTEYYCDVIKQMGDIHKKYFNKTSSNEVQFDMLTPEEKKVFHLGWLFTQIIFNVLTSSFIDENGNVSNNSADELKNLETSAKELIPQC